MTRADRTMPPCPMCGHSRNCQPNGDIYVCRVHGLYDGVDDVVVYTDPTKRIEQQEKPMKQFREWQFKR